MNIPENSSDILIAGGGIGGLSAALFLHGKGHRVRVFEAVSDLKELGFGINIQGHAVRELEKVGLSDRVEAAGGACVEFGLFNQFGQELWREPRGRAAGEKWAQVSIHRGRLHSVLLEAVRERMGADAVTTGHRLSRFEERDDRVVAHFATSGGGVAEATGQVLIGADGIHSAVRASLFPDEGAPIYAGYVLWRGCVRFKPYRSGGMHAVIGHPNQKFICYPLEPVGADGLQLTNWVCQTQRAAMLNRADWNRVANTADLLPLYEKWNFDWLDIPALIRSTPTVLEYPMIDRNPLPRWTFGRVTLLGDAAHPMYPIGANAGSQAIRDASALADAMSSHADPRDALVAYEAERREVTGQILLSNRRLGPEEVLKLAYDRAPNGFANIEDVISRAELEEVSQRYRKLTASLGSAKA
jgi:2-polyprenyl-6-methoxyphenol hydroxylase-like FAD-dependent oxidoreductase